MANAAPIPLKKHRRARVLRGRYVGHNVTLLAPDAALPDFWRCGLGLENAYGQRKYLEILLRDEQLEMLPPTP